MPRVGFDRRVSLEWMDLASRFAREGPSSRDGARRLEDALRPSGRASTKADRNNLTVLRHVWLAHKGTTVILRPDALRHLENLTGPDRLWIHWGMTLAAYSFFRDVALAVGRLLTLQDAFTLATVTRRVSDRHGDTTTVRRATQRVVRSMIDWGTLVDTDTRGRYRVCQPLVQPSSEVAVWLVRAVLACSEVSSLHVANLGSMPELYPFRLRVSPVEVMHDPFLDVHRQGLATDVVELKLASRSESVDRLSDREKVGRRKPQRSKGDPRSVAETTHEASNR